MFYLTTMLSASNGICQRGLPYATCYDDYDQGSGYG